MDDHLSLVRFEGLFAVDMPGNGYAFSSGFYLGRTTGVFLAVRSWFFY